jgi:hypothetical protein
VPGIERPIGSAALNVTWLTPPVRTTDMVQCVSSDQVACTGFPFSFNMAS